MSGKMASVTGTSGGINRIRIPRAITDRLMLSRPQAIAVYFAAVPTWTQALFLAAFLFPNLTTLLVSSTSMALAALSMVWSAAQERGFEEEGHAARKRSELVHMDRMTHSMCHGIHEHGWMNGLYMDGWRCLTPTLHSINTHLSHRSHMWSTKCGAVVHRFGSSRSSTDEDCSSDADTTWNA